MLIRVFPSHWKIREAGSLEEKGKGFSLLPFFVRQVPILDSGLANRGGTVGYIFIAEKNNYLRLRGFVGSSFLGFFNFLVAMLGVPPYFFGLPDVGRRLDYRHITRRPCQQILVFSVSRNTAYGQEMVQDSKSVGTKKGGKAKLPPFVPITFHILEAEDRSPNLRLLACARSASQRNRQRLGGFKLLGFLEFLGHVL